MGLEPTTSRSTTIPTEGAQVVLAFPSCELRVSTLFRDASTQPGDLTSSAEEDVKELLSI
jgi:hypothetical protein